MGRLQMLTRRRRPERSAVRWESVDADDLARHADLVERMAVDDLDGATIRGVYPREVAAEAGRRTGDLLDHGTPVVFGHTLGRPLLQGGMSADTTAHRDDAERMLPLYRDLFGFDPHERLGERLAPVLGGRPWTTPSEDGRRYNPGNIRHMAPGRGGLPAHAGIEFLVSNGEGSAKHLLATTHAREHMSYFVVLQPPESGGELSVFEQEWDGPDAAEEVSPLTGDEAFDSVPRLPIAPDPGDLVLFNGGRRWHRVEPVHGSVARVTYGGFVAPSIDRTAFNCWS